MEHFKVFQVLEDGSALAFHCRETDHNYCAVGITVLLTPQKGLDYYDDLYVTLPAGRCAQQDGVVQYETRDKFTKTVPVIRWGYEYEAENKEEASKRFKEQTDEFIYECKQYVLDKADTPENMKKCECLAEEVADAFLKGKEPSRFEIEKKCSNNKITKKKKK